MRERKRAAVRKATGPYRQAGVRFQAFPTPDDEAQKMALVANAATMIDEFPRLLSKLEALLRAVQPLHLIAILGHYGLLSPASGSRNVLDKPLMRGIQQHHLELLQALALHLPADRWGSQPASPGDVEEAAALLPALSDAFLSRRFLAAQGVEALDERYRLLLQEKMRLHTQMVRYWGHHQRAIELFSMLYTPLDALFREETGFAPTDIIAIAQALVALHEERSTRHLDALGKVFAERAPERAVRRYFELFMPGEDADRYWDAMPRSWPLSRIRSGLLAHSDPILAKLAHYSIAEIAERSKVRGEAVAAIMDMLAYEPGSLVSSDPEHFFLSNPVSLRPVLKQDGNFFVSTPQTLLSFFDQIVRSLARTGKLKQAIEEQRAKFLEEEVVRLFASRLPDATLLPQLRWSDEGRSYETDCVVIYDDLLLIVEAKSGSISDPGLRGAPDRVRRHVEDLIIHPSVQSARLERIIREAKAKGTETTNLPEAIGSRIAGITEIIRVTVTLEDFTIIASAEKELQLAGWLPDGLSLACTLGLSNLQTIAELLDGDAPFFHYIAERANLQRRAQVLGDELDMLGLYLKTCFNAAKIEESWPQLSVSGFSSEIDAWLFSRSRTRVSKRPKLQLHPYFAKLLRSIEGHRQPGWLGLSLDVLRAFDIEEQKRVARQLDRLSKQAVRKENFGRAATLSHAAHRASQSSIMFHVYPAEHHSQRHLLSERLGRGVIEATGRARCIIIGRNVARWHEPYSYVTVVSGAADRWSPLTGDQMSGP